MDKQGDKRTILAIDDDANILDILKLGLETEGFQVQTANSPEAGVATFQQHHGQLQLVLLDYIMPGMRGDVVFHKLRQIDPQVPVLLLTACDEQVAKELLAQGLRGYVQKPFFFSHLLDQIQRVTPA